MPSPVKPRRYDNSRRQAQARATRADVVAAGMGLFVERGYAATTVETIAEHAGTAPATVYRLFGSKRGVLTAVLDTSFVGDDERIAFGDRADVRAVLGDPDPRRLLEGFARLCRELLDRSASVQHVLRNAASVDPEAAEVLALVKEHRLKGQSRIAGALAARHALAGNMAESEAADVIYTLMSPETHWILTVDRSWTADRYQRWLAETLCAVLLSTGVRRTRRR